MDYKVIYASSPSELSNKVKEYVADNWEPIGSHQVATIHSQNRFRGDQLVDTKHELEYSQTLVKKINKNVIEVDIAYYHPDDDETKKVFDEEGMRAEFENKLSNLW